MIDMEIHGATKMFDLKSGFSGGWSHSSSTIESFAIPTCYLGRGRCKFLPDIMALYLPLKAFSGRDVGVANTLAYHQFSIFNNKL
jgi:hypothetical protein